MSNINRKKRKSHVLKDCNSQPSKKRKLSSCIEKIFDKHKKSINVLKQERNKCKKERDYFKNEMEISKENMNKYKQIYLQVIGIIQPLTSKNQSDIQLTSSIDSSQLITDSSSQNNNINGEKTKSHVLKDSHPSLSNKRRLSSCIENIFDKHKNEISTLKEETNKYKKERDYFKTQMNIYKENMNKYKEIYSQMMAIIKPSQSEKPLHIQPNINNINSTINIESNVKQHSNTITKRKRFKLVINSLGNKESEKLLENNVINNINTMSIHKWLYIKPNITTPITSQKTSLKPFKMEPKKDLKSGKMRYNPKVHPTICSSKEIGELRGIVNNFACKLRGRRNVSWRMIKQILNTRQNVNMRARTRYELLQVYHKTSTQCKHKHLETLNDNINKVHKKCKRTTFWDARFPSIQEKKGRGNSKLFRYPCDFNDKKVTSMTRKMTKKMVKELDACIPRVVDLTTDNESRCEHASHQQAIRSAHQKLNLIVQRNETYKPNDMWETHWGQFPVNPYIKQNVEHHLNTNTNNIPPPIPIQPPLHDVHTQHIISMARQHMFTLIHAPYHLHARTIGHQRYMTHNNYPSVHHQYHSYMRHHMAAHGPPQ